ncbi:hypothetical protein [Methanococcoides sp. AM1]|uniref:hypothetical protein n=1 Tax=Methanococcoides sp. AM1 TaxID=1201011 RepID=UPI0010834C3A|nr:hypothetical protein [Methanococcoides sp. AM1]
MNTITRYDREAISEESYHRDLYRSTQDMFLNMRISWMMSILFAGMVYEELKPQIEAGIKEKIHPEILAYKLLSEKVEKYANTNEWFKHEYASDYTDESTGKLMSFNDIMLKMDIINAKEKFGKRKDLDLEITRQLIIEDDSNLSNLSLYTDEIVNAAAEHKARAMFD